MNNKVYKRILIVDDDIIIRKLLTKVLEGLGYSVVSVCNGQEAIEILAQESISLVITDLNMPGMSGTDLCEAIRALDYKRYIYIIVITTQTDSKSLVDSMQAGADDYISKPFNNIELIARLNAGLRVIELEENLTARNKLLTNTLDQIQLEQDEAKSTLFGVLPSPLEIGGVHFNWLFEPSSFIGGDIFDYFQLGSSHLCFYMVDVAGHGVTAALHAFSIYHDIQSSKSKLESLVKSKTPLSEIAVNFLINYNAEFLEKNCNHCYFTMFFGLMNIKSGAISIAQAGHPPAILVDAENQEIKIIGDGGLPMGLINNVSYEAISFQMKDGDRLFIYSDGVTDCENNLMETFGQSNLEKVIQANMNKNSAVIMANINSSLKAWLNKGETYRDDVTCLILDKAIVY